METNFHNRVLKSNASSSSYGLYQCISDEYSLAYCIPMTIYVLSAIVIEAILITYLYRRVHFQTRMLKKKNIILGCLLLDNLAYIVYNISRGSQYIYFIQNYFMNVQLTITIYYFASKAFKVIQSENVKIVVKAFFAVVLMYDFGILILNFIEYIAKSDQQICKSNTWTYIRVAQLILSICFASLGKYIIDKMEEQIKQMGIRDSQQDIFNHPTEDLPEPLLENVRQYQHKSKQKRNIWILIIVNLIAGVTQIIKNFIILYNGRDDCLFISEGSSGSEDMRDVIQTSLNFITKVLYYFMPLIASLVVFRVDQSQTKTYSQEFYYEEGVYTTALGMKPTRRSNIDDESEELTQKRESMFDDGSLTNSKSKDNSPPLRQSALSQPHQKKDQNRQTKSINDIKPYNQEF